MPISESLYSSKTDMWETPQELFDELDHEFHFDLDVCATPENAKCKRYYTPEQDGRLVNYLPGDTVYDRFGMEWTVTSSEIHKFDDGALRYLYRCGHSGTNDYCALYSDEILTREEADAALALKGGEV